MESSKFKIFAFIIVNILFLGFAEFILMENLKQLHLPIILTHLLVVTMLLLVGIPFIYFFGGRHLWKVMKEKDSLSIIFDKLNELVVFIEVEDNERFRCLTVNDAYLKVMEMKPEQVVGKYLEDVMNSGELAFTKEMYQETIASNKSSKYEKEIKTKQGNVNVDITIVPIFNASGKCTHLLVLAQDITEQRAERERLEYLALYDELTQIQNRRAFEERYLKQWEFALFEKEAFSLILFDIDYFKQLNDVYGHIIGDKCLRKIALTANKIVEQQGGWLFRYGGEEFAVLLKEDALQEAYKVAEKIRKSIAQLKLENKSSKVQPFVTISAGVGTINPSWGEYPNQFIDAVDQSLYEAKKQGRNRVLCMESSYICIK